MATLPQEICDDIGAALSGPGLAPLATISRSWQVAVERQTFRHVRLCSSDLAYFERIMASSPRRRRFVRSIDFTVALAGYTEDDRGRFEREPDRQFNDFMFSEAVHELLRVLASWGECRDGAVSISVSGAESPSDHEAGHQLGKSVEPVDADAATAAPPDAKRDLGDRRFQYSFLQLLNPEELPTVRCVGRFNTHLLRRVMSFRAAVDIAAKLPCLRHAYWSLHETQCRYPVFRRQNRDGLAEALQNTAIKESTMRELHIDMTQNVLWNPDWLPSCINEGSSEPDALSTAIRETVGRMPYLLKMAMNGAIDQSLFQPGPQIAQPLWQSMRYLDIHFHPANPAGGWHFRSASRPAPPPLVPLTPDDAVMPPGHGHSEQDDIQAALRYSDTENSRLSGYTSDVLDDPLPSEASLIPLIRAYGRACAQMPALQVASLITVLPKRLELPPTTAGTANILVPPALWGIWFLGPRAAPLQPRHRLDPALFEASDRRRLFWDVRQWRPDEELRDVMANIGRERFGGEMEEAFVDSWTTALKPFYLKHFKNAP